MVNCTSFDLVSAPVLNCGLFVAVHALEEDSHITLSDQVVTRIAVEMPLFWYLILVISLHLGLEILLDLS